MSESKNENESEIGFFKKLYMSIFKVDEYSKFSDEKFSKAVKYFLLLILLVTILVTIPLVYSYNTEVSTAFNYVKNDLPDFEFIDGKYISSVNDVEGYDSKYDAKIYINTDSENLTEDKINEIAKTLSEHQYGIFIMNDKVRVYSIEYDSLSQNYVEISYDEITEYLDISDEGQINKDYIVNYLGSNLNTIIMYLAIMMFTSLYISNIISYVFVMLVISIIGYTYNMINDMKLKVRDVFSLAMYSCTLGIFLVTVISIVSIFKTINLEYMTSIQMLVSVIYLVAAMMIIRSDNKKVKQEVGAIVAEASGVVESTEDQDVITADDKDTKKDDKDDDKKDDDDSKDKKDELKNDDEPDGSEI